MTQILKNRSRKLLLPWILLLGLGISFRIINLDLKPYWEDETLSSLRISGYQFEQVVSQVYNNQVISVEDILQFQAPHPNLDFGDTLDSLAQHPEHSPLFYSLARLWMSLAGSSIEAMRWLPALLSFFIFPALYWLCVELFPKHEAHLVAHLSTAFVAVSPILIRYAQEVREYSLWTVAIPLTGAALLRALRLNRLLPWLIYSLVGAFALYTHLLSALLLVSNGLYVLVAERDRLRSVAYPFLLSTLGSIALFLPWLRLTQLATTYRNVSWLEYPISFSTLVKSWGLNLSHVFFSWPQTHNSQILICASIAILGLLLLALQLMLCQSQTAGRHTWYLLIMIGTTTLPFVLADLMLDGRRSRIDRYFLPCYIGLALIVAYLLANKLTLFSRWSQQFWKIITVFILTLSTISSATNTQALTWWGESEFQVHSANILNQQTEAIIISDARLSQVLPLAYRLKSNFQLLLLNKPKLEEIPQTETPLFVFHPSQELKINLEQQDDWELKQLYRFQDDAFVVKLFQFYPNSRSDCPSKMSDTFYSPSNSSLKKERSRSSIELKG